MRFNAGDKVRLKHEKTHTGVVIHQTDNRVLWECKCGMVGDDLANFLELVKK